MKFSICTPTHRSYKFLECVQSVLDQRFKDWEMIITPNNGFELPPIPKDPRIKVIPYTLKNNMIGAIKQFTFSQGQGDFLVELDSDDLLLPGCLETLNEATKSNKDFYYSDAVYFKDKRNTGEFLPFNRYYNWKYENVAFRDGKDEMVGIRHLSETPTPNSFSTIHYAPDHVRVWKKEFYDRIGGHDVTYSVCDDHELLIRTYLNGSIEQINDCLYAYRVVGAEGNSWLQRSQAIQDTTQKLYHQHLESLVLRWGSLNGLPSYDLCSWKNPRAGFIGVDKVGAEIVADLDTRWPFADNSVACFRGMDCFEHLRDKNHTMSELYRCLAPGGWVLSQTPTGDSRAFFRDPTHVSGWIKDTFDYYTDREVAQFINNDKVRFRETFASEEYPSPWHKERDYKYVIWHAYALKGGPEEQWHGPVKW